ncbi:MAG: winged helix-turn-helix domain-containing protein, partial [Acidimicrobiia bacterium]|nr:winged helix-turn-helix domain-containing protein [Acidimicrobiia bacterium]
WGHGKLALEYLFAKGRLNVSHRTNFTRYYATPETVLPEEVLEAPPLSKEEGIDDLTVSAMRGLGVATEADIAQYWRMKRADVRPSLARLVASGHLEPVDVDGWRSPAWLLPGLSIPHRIAARALLTPFDPVVWAPRDRSERIHGFDYTIEIYVPEEKRVFGYYVYPFLLGDRIVGRVDLKSDRSTGRLLARATWIEDHADPAHVAPHLAAELHDMAGWLGMDEVEVGRKGNLADEVRRVV